MDFLGPGSGNAEDEIMLRPTNLDGVDMTQTKMVLNSKFGRKWSNDARAVNISIIASLISWIIMKFVRENYDGDDSRCEGQDMSSSYGLVFFTLTFPGCCWLLLHQTNRRLLYWTLTCSVAPLMIWTNFIRAELTITYVNYMCFGKGGSSGISKLRIVVDFIESGFILGFMPAFLDAIQIRSSTKKGLWLFVCVYS